MLADFLVKNKGKLIKIGIGAVLVGTNSGLLYMASEVVQEFGPVQIVTYVASGITMVAGMVMDFKKKKDEEYIDEDDL